VLRDFFDGGRVVAALGEQARPTSISWARRAAAVSLPERSALAGPWNFLFLYVVPLFVANSVIMSYIATNHFLNPLTEINDPLANTLSVTSPRWLEKLHLQFGYHVEHHLFPTLSGRHAPVVRDVLIRLYGDRYLTMPHVRALRLLYTRPKLHDGYDMLVDPRTMTAFDVLAPGDLSMSHLSSG